MSLEFKMLEMLRNSGVPFVIVGGLAVAYHGYVRATEDVDVVWLRSTETERPMFKALERLCAHCISKEIDPDTGIERTYWITEAFVRSSHVMMLDTKYGFLDLYDFIPGFPAEDVRQLLDSSVEAEGYRFASLKWLRKMKKAAGRTKDLLDLENLPG
ncbi:MAG: hypothetical protein JWL69_1715 [Phycisphaerales bacterium]|nr:hypothetical protein [Phycisphaerales bacterium]